LICIKAKTVKLETIALNNFQWIHRPMDNPDHALFEFLDNTHIAIHAHLKTLKDVVQRIHEDRLQSSDAVELGRLCHFFDTVVREHHLQEETLVFPSLIHSDDLRTVRVANQLFQDHGWLEENWIELGPMLRAVENGQSWPNISELVHGFDIFFLLNMEHMELEETVAYPQAKASLKKWRTAKSGRELHQLNQSQLKAARLNKPHHHTPS
jgi:hemerythrin-like domain-containing protein